MSASALRTHGWIADLGVCAALVLATTVALLAAGVPWPVERVLGVVFLLILPGYAFVSMLFPESPGRTPRSSLLYSNGGPDWTVRFALSLVTSVVVVAAVTAFLSWLSAIRLTPVVLAISAVTLAALATAAGRRLRLPREYRANPFADLPLGRFSAGTTLQTTAMVIALLALVSAVAFAGAAPTQGETYSESYLLAEGDNGDLVADGYPSTFVAGEEESLHVGIENHEHQSMSYEVVVVAQEISDGSIVVQEQVDRFDVELAHGESTTVERDIAPTITGEGIRLQFLVYKGSAPETPGAESADQTLHLWIDVEEPE